MSSHIALPVHVPELVRQLRHQLENVRPLSVSLVAAAADEIMRLRERLEIGYAFNVAGERIASDHSHDGIECRDATIKAQDEQIDSLGQRLSDGDAERAGLQGALKNIGCRLDEALGFYELHKRRADAADAYARQILAVIDEEAATWTRLHNEARERLAPNASEHFTAASAIAHLRRRVAALAKNPTAPDHGSTGAAGAQQLAGAAGPDTEVHGA